MMIFLTDREVKRVYESLHSHMVDMMRLVNDSYITVDPAMQEAVRKKYYDEMDETDDLLDRLKSFM